MSRTKAELGLELSELRKTYQLALDEGVRLQAIADAGLELAKDVRRLKCNECVISIHQDGCQCHIHLSMRKVFFAHKNYLECHDSS